MRRCNEGRCARDGASGTHVPTAEAVEEATVAVATEADTAPHAAAAAAAGTRRCSEKFQPTGRCIARARGARRHAHTAQRTQRALTHRVHDARALHRQRGTPRALPRRDRCMHERKNSENDVEAKERKKKGEKAGFFRGSFCVKMGSRERRVRW
eukprot:EC814628.1.p1 GENE.EC814628.1~~EC814628.1.p1  ORF type:complete len:154 (-),score=15.34 EC814628.1:187-648(-)